jgi:hypothetical protein
METKMSRTINLTLLAACAAALFAAPVSAQTVQHRKVISTYNGAAIPSGRIYLLENNGFRNTNVAENFQDKFCIDY